ncbi:MAG: restriction endonuclease [Synergistaceae bacterium]|nr:restriction endonuclease [Synergistaceae bacterium]
MNLTQADISELLPGGRKTKFENHVSWAKTYLNKAGLIETPQKGKYRITEAGREALQSGEKIDVEFLSRIGSFRSFQATSSESSKPIEAERGESPAETLDAAYRQVTDVLASQLMGEIMQLSPSGFERLVVKLLLSMDYGNGIDDAGTTTQLTNDGGIDGVIREDQLGFSNIYIQAKQWSPEQTVSRPELHKFVGALQGQQAQRGLFITTAKFSEGAVQYVTNLSGVKVVLIDGATLTRLMIKHNVGVSVEHVYEIKRVDSDFFSEEL